MENIRFGKLVVKEFIKSPGNNHWLCLCDCGGTRKVKRYSDLTKGDYKSCGCNSHGLKRLKNPLYGVWTEMKKRCYNPNQKTYGYYGGRGIKVCNEWINNPIAFVNWSEANGYKQGLTIDRINTNGNYEPNNCRWVTLKENQNNRRSNVIIEYQDIEYTIQELVEKIAIVDRSCFYHRYYISNWDLERALFTPSRRAIN